jgi:hypothetical protein
MAASCTNSRSTFLPMLSATTRIGRARAQSCQCLYGSYVRCAGTAVGPVSAARISKKERHARIGLAALILVLLSGAAAAQSVLDAKGRRY